MVSSHHDDYVVPRFARSFLKLNGIASALNVSRGKPINHVALNHFMELPVVSPALRLIVNYSSQFWAHHLPMKEKRSVAT
jgi:hypothetical protein